MNLNYINIAWLSFVLLSPALAIILAGLWQGISEIGVTIIDELSC